MPRYDALITPQLLVWARERVNVPVEIVAKSASVTVDKYQAWESGELLPTISQARKIAKKTKIPYAWLFLDKPPDKFKLPKNADYRTMLNKAIGDNAMELSYVLADASMRRDAMIELYTEMDMQLPHFKEYLDSEATSNAVITKAIRDLLGITYERQRKFINSNEAYNYYMETLATIGVLVFQVGKVEKNVMRGMSIHNKVFPIIIVNRKDEYNARIFTLMHELVHIITRTPGICDDFSFEHQSRYEIENRCNQVAAEVLVPKDELLAEHEWIKISKYGWDDNCIQKIARNFTVSREVIIGRLFTLNKIGFDFYRAKLAQFTKEYEQYQSNIKDIRKDGFLPPSTDICSQIGKLYARTVMSAYSQEIITPRDASQFLSGLRVQHFSKIESWCFS
jgi:Zn-dependent peptidase ImmA (M78 family)/DNA-binding XRE family transcriptional regulator